MMTQKTPEVEHKNIVTLIEWRDETYEKRKARAIQRAIDKKIQFLTDDERSMLIIWLRSTKKRLEAW